MLDEGTICRSRDPIIKSNNDDTGRLCRVLTLVPQHRWRDPNVPEYKVELLSMPVTAFRRENDLLPVRSDSS